MNKTLLILTVSTGMLFAACGKSDKKSVDTEEAGTAAMASEESATFNVDTEASTVQWTGRKVISGSHTGTVNVTSGSLSTEDGQITAGNFTIDMSSITETENDDADSKGKLEGHLKSADFFHVDSFSTAKFEITEAAEGKVKGNLTIKGITKQIEIPVTKEMTDNGMTATSQFTINRNDWNVTWGNNSTNKIEMLKDNFIANDIEFNVKLVATK